MKLEQSSHLKLKKLKKEPLNESASIAISSEDDEEAGGEDEEEEAGAKDEEAAKDLLERLQQRVQLA